MSGYWPLPAGAPTQKRASQESLMDWPGLGRIKWQGTSIRETNTKNRDEDIPCSLPIHSRLNLILLSLFFSLSLSCSFFSQNCSRVLCSFSPKNPNLHRFTFHTFPLPISSPAPSLFFPFRLSPATLFPKRRSTVALGRDSSPG